MNSFDFDPFRQGITISELTSFMQQNFPMVTFDQRLPMTELQTSAKKWIDIASRASAHKPALVSKALSLPTKRGIKDVSKVQPLSRKRCNNNDITPATTKKNEDEDRPTGSIKRGRKGVEGKDFVVKADKKNGEGILMTRNNPSRASKSEANSKTTLMYSIKSNNQRTHSRRKNSRPSVSDTNSKRPKLKEDPLDDSSSLTAISDDEDDPTRKPSTRSSAPKSKHTSTSTVSALGELEGLKFGGQESAATSGPVSPASCDADLTLLDLEILDTVKAVPERNLCQLQTAGDVKSDLVKPMDIHQASSVHHTCNVGCSKELSDLKARIQKLEDLVFAPYRVPPPCVASILEEYNRL